MTRQLPISQAVKHFQVTERTIRRWIKSGKVKAKLVDGRYLISVDLTEAPDIDNDMSDDRSMDMSPDNDNAELLEQIRKENAYLQEIISEKDRQIESQAQQIDHLTQVIAMSQKNITLLAEQLDGSKQQLEDLRNRTVWQRVKAVFKADA